MIPAQFMKCSEAARSLAARKNAPIRLSITSASVLSAIDTGRGQAPGAAQALAAMQPVKRGNNGGKGSENGSGRTSEGS